MKTKTPETDAAKAWLGKSNTSQPPLHAPVVSAAFAEKLERERDEWKACAEELEAIKKLLAKHDNDFAVSKDWAQSDTLGKVDWLIDSLKAKKQELEIVWKMLPGNQTEKYWQLLQKD
jgi:hypothetical protein